MHFKDHVYMKSINKDFPKTLLQQFNFHSAEEDVPTTQAATSEEEWELGDEDQPASQEVEGVKSEIDNSP